MSEKDGQSPKSIHVQATMSTLVWHMSRTCHVTDRSSADAELNRDWGFRNFRTTSSSYSREPSAPDRSRLSSKVTYRNRSNTTALTAANLNLHAPLTLSFCHSDPLTFNQHAINPKYRAVTNENLDVFDTWYFIYKKKNNH